MEHVEQFQIILSYVKPQMMTSGSIRLRKLGCEKSKWHHSKLLIDIFPSHICFAANMFVFEGIRELFSNNTLENRVYLINIKCKEKQSRLCIRFLFLNLSYS